ncbi:unnamed protein product [Cochlearia groenlandica]
MVLIVSSFFVSHSSRCFLLLILCHRHAWRITAKKISPETMPIVAEYAKSNRSLCKSCSNTIASKTLRVGLISKGPGGIDMTRWHHLNCFPSDSETIGSVGEIKGLGDLEVGEKEEEVKHPGSDEISGEKTKETKGSSASSKVIAEYAKSSRSSCKKCSQTIASKEMRLGLVTRDSRGFDMTKWHHSGCFPVQTDPVDSVEDIGGFSSLQKDDQDALKELFIQGGQKTLVDLADEKEDEVENPPPDETSGQKIKETKESSASAKVIAEYAKSSRSSCKKCSQTIAAKELRLGLVSRNFRGYDMTKWHHLGCFPADTDPIDSVENIGGFSSLQAGDQDSLKELVKQCEKKTLVKIINTNEGTSQVVAEAEISLSASDVKDKYRDARLLPKWKAFETVIFLERDDGLNDSEKIAAFDFDGCLAKTSVKITGADAWSLMYPCIPEKLQSLYSQGYKLVIFTNESNIDRWKNKRQAAVDSKIGRLNSFIELVKVPIQVFIACGVAGSGGKEDLYRKPKAGMWQLMKKHFNSGITIDMDKSFYVGDAAGRKGDHSDADIKFAQANGLKFLTPEEYFIA